MRFLEKIGSWLRTVPRVDPTRPQDALERGVDTQLAQRLPATPPDQFRERLLDAVQRAHDKNAVVLEGLDPAVRVLVLPPRDAQKGESPVGDEVDGALRQLEAQGRTWSSVTWSALRDARPPFSPSASEWAGDLAHRFDGDAGVIFFVDVEAVAIAVSHAAEAGGLQARIDDDAMLVRVTDGRFEAHVGTSALLAEALWTAKGPLAAVTLRARALPNEMRSFLATLRGLERRFPAMRFDVRADAIMARSANGSHKLDYRRTSVAMRAAGLTTDEWLKRVQLEDLVDDAGDPLVLVRSPKYLRAYPNALAAPVDAADPAGGARPYALVAVREKDGRTAPVLRMAGDSDARFGHYQDESTRQLPFFSFAGHAFVVEQAQKGGPARAACLVGDKAASVAIHDALVRGALEQMTPIDGRVLVRSYSENTAWFVSTRAGPELIEEVKRRARELELDLCGETSDALSIEREIELPPIGFGHFDLTPVPEAYFGVRDQAHSRSDLGRGHSDYLRGLAYEMLGRTELAVQSFERAVRQTSDDGEMNLALGRALCTLDEHQRAVVFLERAAEALDEHAEAHNALGSALHKVGEVQRAYECFQAAVRLAPDDLPYLVNLGRAASELKHYGEARSSLEHALRIEPSAADAHAALAVVCHRTGQKKQALHHAKEALAERPGDETVQELLKLIDDET